MTVQDGLIAALADTTRALEAGDAVTAAAAMQLVVQACDEARTSSTLLTPTVLEEATRLFDRCISKAAEVQTRLFGELAQASLGRRAVAAYRSR